MKRAIFLVAVLALSFTVLAGCAHVTGETAGQTVDDSVITSQIKEKILTDPELKTFAIDVGTNRGNVTLSGQVPNQAAQQRLVQYARNTKGVTSVRTNLSVAGTG